LQAPAAVSCRDALPVVRAPGGCHPRGNLAAARPGCPVLAPPFFLGDSGWLGWWAFVAASRKPHPVRSIALGAQGRGCVITETKRIEVMVFGLQNRTFGRCLAAGQDDPCPTGVWGAAMATGSAPAVAGGPCGPGDCAGGDGACRALGAAGAAWQGARAVGGVNVHPRGAGLRQGQGRPDPQLPQGRRAHLERPLHHPHPQLGQSHHALRGHAGAWCRGVYGVGGCWAALCGAVGGNKGHVPIALLYECHGGLWGGCKRSTVQPTVPEQQQRIEVGGGQG
jgi:hypothetical protein